MAVGFSHLKVGGAVAGYFLGKGWKRVGIASGDDRRAMLRREGFVATIGRDVPTAIVPAPSNLERGRRALADLLLQEPALEAVCCSSDQLAHGVLVEARARGLRVPERSRDLRLRRRRLRCPHGAVDLTVHVDGPEIGRIAARLVIARCRGETIDRPVVDVGFRLIERESTATPTAHRRRRHRRWHPR